MAEVSPPNPVPVMMPTRGEEGILEAMKSEASRILRSILEPPEKFLRVVASKSHLSEETQAFIDELAKTTGHIEQVSKGSSLKLCMVAEGEADIYPRLGPTMEWDTAAAHAVVLGAGKRVNQFGLELPLRYNKPDLLNPWFVVS